MPDYKKKYMPIVVTVYVLICLIALGLGLAKRNANLALSEASVAEESTQEITESTEMPIAEEAPSSASSDPLVDAASQFINRPSKAEQPVSGDMTAVLIAVVSVCFGMWLADRRKQHGKDAPSIFQLFFSRRKK